VFGDLTDFRFGKVENVDASSEVELDEFEEIELFGLFHPTAALFGTLPTVFDSIFKSSLLQMFASSNVR